MAVTTDIEWKDISNELYRDYIFPKKEIVRIDKPLKLNVSKSGGHRVISADGKSHYIPTGWIHLVWEGIDGVTYTF